MTDENHAAPFRSMRAWLRCLHATGRLTLTRPEVELKHELAAVAKAMDGTQAPLFPRPSGHAMPVVSGILSDRDWMAEAMGVGPDELVERYGRATREPIAWQEVVDAPAQQVVHRAPLDLGELLPLPTHSEHDSGAYITAGLLIARNPTTGVQNVSINRCQLSGPDRLGILILPRHAHFFYQQAERAGEALDVAVVIGVDPMTLLASQAILPVDHDELEVAGALLGGPLAVAKCITSELRVPAEAEIVIEGRVLPRVREPEGPFGEFPQSYGPKTDKPVIQVDVVSHRRNAIYHTILGGGLDHLLLGAIPREATLLTHLKRSFLNVLDVRFGLGGVGRYHLCVKVRQPQAGEAKNIIMAAFGGHYDIKQVIIVDEDVDIDNPREIEWAVATRFQADRDLVVVAGAQGSKLDPSASNDGISAKMGLDATVPPAVDPFRYLRIRVPGEELVVPSEYINPLDQEPLESMLEG